MGVNKVEYEGNTLIDLTGDTVTPDVLLSGYTAHDASGEVITGMAVRASRSSTDTGTAVTATDNSYIIYTALASTLTITCTTNNLFGCIIRVTFASGGKVVFSDLESIDGDDYGSAAVGETWEFSILDGYVICKKLTLET